MSIFSSIFGASKQDKVLDKALRSASNLHNALMFNTHLKSILHDKYVYSPSVKVEVEKLIASYIRNKQDHEIQALGLLILNSNFPFEAIPDPSILGDFQYKLRSFFKISSELYKKHEQVAVAQAAKDHD